MPDIRLIRGKTTVRIDLFPQDIVAIVTQEDVLKSLTSEELEKLYFSIQSEIQGRTK